jgi:2,3,4,5-tetrahydropyridine-2-carboxylate N-succinyltransferase
MSAKQSAAKYGAELRDELESRPGYERPAAFAVGIATFGRGDRILDTYFPLVNHNEHFLVAAVLSSIVGRTSESGSYEMSREQLEEALKLLDPTTGDGGEHPNYGVLETLLKPDAILDEPLMRTHRSRRVVATFITDLDEPPLDAHDVYLRLHLISWRKVKPHGCNLESIFGLLSNVVWTNHGPLDSDGFESVRLMLRGQGLELKVRSVDKFPRMTDYVIPPGVRILNADNVRLGAHLADGTTVMAAGFINFNAGTLGPSMVEGRISAGVVVDPNSDIGGGASIMGTLWASGGGEVVRIGSHCLLGANSGCGISLGDGCTIEAGLYVTAGARVTMPDGSVVKARDLSGKPGLLFWRNSQTGAIEVKERGNTRALNAALHENKN